MSGRVFSQARIKTGLNPPFDLLEKAFFKGNIQQLIRIAWNTFIWIIFSLNDSLKFKDQVASSIFEQN